MIDSTGGTRGQGAFVLPGMVELEEKCGPSIKRSCITYCPPLDFQTFRRLCCERKIVTNLFHNLFRKLYALLRDRRNPV